MASHCKEAMNSSISSQKSRILFSCKTRVGNSTAVAVEQLKFEATANVSSPEGLENCSHTEVRSQIASLTYRGPQDNCRQDSC